MYVGFLTIGDRFIDGPLFELINNDRAMSYAEKGNICWIDECPTCPAAAFVAPTGGPEFVGVREDPAPWYRSDNPDSENFYGVIGIEVVGAEDSTRQASVTQSISGGGVVGPAYHGPRTMVVRAMAIAADECGLQAGLTWLNMQTTLTVDPCTGDSLTFFDCCPCVCEGGDPTTECWVETYEDLRTRNVRNPNTGEICSEDFWPSTYAQLKIGPGITSETWCSWIVIYRHLRLGPPAFACCVDQCVVPYMRQFHDARVIAGPIILEHPQMNHPGALAVFEMTIAAADPIEHTVLQRSVLLDSLGEGVALMSMPMMAMAAAPSDQFAAFKTKRVGRAELLATIAPPAPALMLAPDDVGWVRQFTQAIDPSPVHLSDGRCHMIRLFSSELADSVRVSIEDMAGEFIVGYYLPSIPAEMLITIDNQTRRVTATALDGTVENILPFVRDFDGSPIKWRMMPMGTVMLNVDRAPDDLVELHVELLTASVAAA